MKRFFLPLSLILLICVSAMVSKAQLNETGEAQVPEVGIDSLMNDSLSDGNSPSISLMDDFPLTPVIVSDSMMISVAGNMMEGPAILIPDVLDEFFLYAQNDTIMRLAVVLSDIYGKKDMEFVRGLLLGLKHAGLPENSISLKIINGEIPRDSLQDGLEGFGPHVIIDTHEKDFPASIIDYARESDIRVLNVFDARANDYQSTSGVFQLLSPSEIFNPSVSEYLKDKLSDHTLIMVGEPDPNDNLIRELILAWPEDNLIVVNKDDIKKLNYEDGENYIFFPISTQAKVVTEILPIVKEVLAENTGSSVKVLGRPNWVSFPNMSSMIENVETYIPVRCYFEPTDAASKLFIKNYKDAFGHPPIKSYPVYAAMGYDVAKYFIPNLLDDIRGKASSWDKSNLVQSYFHLNKNDWGGYVNEGNFVLHFLPWGVVEKDLIN